MHQLDLSMRASLYKVWSGEQFSTFQDYISTLKNDPVFESLMRRRRWRRHYDWIESKLSSKALFGQDENSGITVRSVYKPLRCAWEEFEDLSDEKEIAFEEVGRRQRKLKRIVNVEWLQGTLTNWLWETAGKESDDTLRVLAGGPGSGKSTVARIFATEVAHKEKLNVCFIELQHFNLSNDLRSSLASEMTHAREGVGLGDDPIKWQDQFDDRPILFVFDGLDELVNHAKLDEDISRDFFQKVRNFLRDVNRGRARACALVTGRPGAVSVALSNAHLNTRVLLEMMPLCALRDQQFLKSERMADELEIIDRQNLVDQDHRPEFWNIWCKGTNQEKAALPGALEVKQLDAFTAEPLLFFLLILSGYATEPDQAAENKNVIYRKIFEDVHSRDAEKRASRGDEQITQDQFFVLMECLALAIWHGGGRTGSDEKFEAIRDWHAGREKKQLASLEGASLKNVALQFYTRNETIGSDAGFEFIHKSFGEYLTACALFRVASVLAVSEDPNEELAAKWLKRTGAAQISREIIGFLKDEVKLLDLETVAGIADSLTDLLNWAIRNGLPAHADGIEGTWRDAEARQRNASGSLLAVLNAVCHFQKTFDQNFVLEIDWAEEFTARRFLDMLHVTNGSLHPHSIILSGIDFTRPGDELEQTDLTSLQLNYSDLRGSNLNGALMFFSTIIGADLRFAKLNESILEGAKILEVDLEYCELKHAVIEDADLSSSFLSFSNFGNATLRNANVSYTQCFCTDFEGADLSNANFEYADLQQAYFRNAELKGTNFLFASLVAADLSDTENLTQQQIELAFGDAETTLPDNLKRPSHWSLAALDEDEALNIWNAWKEQRRDELNGENAD